MRVFQAKGTASAKALWWEGAYLRNCYQRCLRSTQTQHTLGQDKRTHQISLLNIRRMFCILKGPFKNIEAM